MADPGYGLELGRQFGSSEKQRLGLIIEVMVNEVSQELDRLGFPNNIIEKKGYIYPKYKIKPNTPLTERQNVVFERLKSQLTNKYKKKHSKEKYATLIMMKQQIAFVCLLIIIIAVLIWLV